MSRDMKVIAIPFAGGNKYSYKVIQNELPTTTEWVTIELPGRGGRFTENLMDTIEVMVEDLFSQIQPHIVGGDYMLYGHSMGTLLGYELTKKLIDSNLKLPSCLYFTGRGAPSTLVEEKVSGYPRHLFWEKVNEKGGLPKEILQNKELLDMYYDILRSDFKAIENYTYTTYRKPFPIPIHVCMGTEEIGGGKDKTTVESIKNWGNETIYPIYTETLEGDHFFILRHPRAIAQKICNTYELTEKEVC